ncbi:MAG: tubulin-like doman-containing protein [Coriobacteriia bacterium]|nr:tubulin-like doman-containing protein [Coriobacteriia bacterium]
MASTDAGTAGRTRVNPSLLIGLGGQGQKSLIEIRRRLESTYGCVPPQVRLISFDTDEPEGAVLKDMELKKLVVPRVWEHIKGNRDHYGRWMDLERIPRQKHKNINKGAGQIRQLGRFAMHFHTSNVAEVFESSIQQINSVSTADDPRWSSTATRQVVFLGSIAGGTGAGTLLDLACAVRNLPEASDYALYAYLAMPGVFRTFEGTHYVEENAYALLKELDFLLTSADSIDSGDYGDVFNVDLGGSLKYTMAHPFDQVMLVDNHNTGDLIFDKPEQLAEAVAIAVFSTLGGEIGKHVDSVLNNPDNQGHPWDGGMRCNYSSFGVAEIYYPREEVVAYMKAKFVERLVVAMDVGQTADAAAEDGTDLSSALENFLAENELRERGQEHNQIVDGILPHQRFPARIPDAATVKADTVDRTWLDNEGALRDFVEAARSTAAARRAEKTADAQERTRARVEELVRTRGGNVSGAFLAELRGTFEAVAQEMAEENEDAKRRIRQHTGAINGLKDLCTQKAGKLFGRREAVRDVLTAYDGALREVSKAHYDEVRTEEARLLCSVLLERFEEWAGEIRAQRSSLDNLVKNASYEKERTREALSQPGAFQIPVQPDVEQLVMPDTRIDAFYAWLAKDRGHDSLAFWQLTTQDAMQVIGEYADAMNAAKVARDLTLAGVLRTKSPEERTEYLRRAHRRAEPLLQHDQAATTKPGRPPADKASTLYLVGGTQEFFDLYRTVDDSGESWGLAERLGSLEVSKVDEKEITDPDRVYFFRRFGAIPAYAFRVFNLLRNEYLEHVNVPEKWSLHLDKRWDELLPDLDPSSADEHGWIWALAASEIEYLRCVEKAGAHYTLQYVQTLADGGAQEVPVKLGQGYEEARKRFLDNLEWVAYVRRRLEKAVENVGRERALQDLEALRESLVNEHKSVKGAKDDSRATALQRDIDAVADYRAQLQQKR